MSVKYTCISSLIFCHDVYMFILTSPQQVRPVPPSGGQVCRTSALFYTQSNKGFGPGFKKAQNLKYWPSV